METKEKIPKILIIGGGIAGVSFGIGLLQKYSNKVDFEIIENRLKNEEATGFGINLVVQGLNALEDLGMMGEIIKNETEFFYGQGVDYFTEQGQLVSPQREFNEKQNNMYFHREYLRQSMLQVYISKSCQITFGEILKSHIFNEETKQLDCVIESKETKVERKVSYDLIVDASGNFSKLRQQYIGDQHVYFGFIVNGIMPYDKKIYSKSNSWAQMGGILIQGVTRLFWKPLKKGFVQWQLTTKIPEEDSIKISKTMSKEEVKKLAETYFSHISHPIIESIKEASCDSLWFAPLYCRQPVDDDLHEKFKVMNESRIVSIGDAAHAMVMFLGQGANTALDDSISLARNLDFTNLDGKSLNLIQKDILEKGAELQKMSFALGEYIHSPDKYKNFIENESKGENHLNNTEVEQFLISKYGQK